MGSVTGQIPHLLFILALFAAYGVAVRRGVLRDMAVLWVGAGVGVAAVIATMTYWWPLYEKGVLPLSLFLFNPFIMLICSLWCVYLAYRAQRVEDIGTFNIGDTKVIVRICPPNRLPEADALLLPTSVTLRFADGIAGLVGMATGKEPENESRPQGPVGTLKVVAVGPGDLKVEKIYMVAVSDYLEKVNAGVLQRGIEGAALAARKDNRESVVVPIAALRGLNLTETARSMVAGTLKQRKAFAEIVFAALSPRDGADLVVEVARQVMKLEGEVITATRKI